MNINEAVERACEEPTLEKALSWITSWVQNGQTTESFEICFKKILDRYPDRKATNQKYLLERCVGYMRPEVKRGPASDDWLDLMQEIGRFLHISKCNYCGDDVCPNCLNTRLEWRDRW